MESTYPKIEIIMSVNGIAQVNRLNEIADALKKTSFFTLRSTTSFQNRLNLFFSNLNILNLKISRSLFKPKKGELSNLIYFTNLLFS